MSRQGREQSAGADWGQRIRRNQEENTLNKDIFEGKWKEMRGQVKRWLEGTKVQ